MISLYNLEKIKFGIDHGTWDKAINLYKDGKIKSFQDNELTWAADVLGAQQYRVVVSKKKYTDGDCTCYLGQNDTLCKHMIAVAIYGLKNGQPLSEEDKIQHNEIKFDGKVGEITEEQLNLTKAEISGAVRYIKAYVDPSRTWFAYQDSLTEGCNRLATIFSTLPASSQTADLIIKTLLRLDSKLTSGGVDDSDGTVEGLIEEAAILLSEFARINPECLKKFELLKGKETCFGWEEPLLNLITK